MALNDKQIDALSLVAQANTGRGNRGLKASAAPGEFRASINALIRRGFIATREVFVGRSNAPTTFYVPTNEGRQVLSNFGA